MNPKSTQSPLDSLTVTARKVAEKGLPPVDQWQPAYCGEIDMRIAPDGTWFYLGTPIGRPALVKLFASILRKDPERHVLVTPVEMEREINHQAMFGLTSNGAFFPMIEAEKLAAR